MTQNIEKPIPTETSVMGGQYDTVSKNVIQQNPEDWIRFGLGVSDVQVIQILDTEQPTVNQIVRIVLDMRTLTEKMPLYILKFRRVTAHRFRCHTG